MNTPTADDVYRRLERLARQIASTTPLTESDARRALGLPRRAAAGDIPDPEPDALVDSRDWEPACA